MEAEWRQISVMSVKVKYATVCITWKKSRRARGEENVKERDRGKDR